ncbi:hypothetical protein SAMN05216228_104827 [Rhizobium tibeticum]|uniref:Uncharacterized protein n=1 Tax=Rhizobium tibeticum TaxID=501024 RepID=A0A1H8VWH5_9HYPH|nr:hypothetical protein RTCCBAU85039_3434 [Rhizobium tibeticum]SEP19749.1 hypothetical protein SAMN05216228_104827 [Rhizobium tibeticum]
MNAFEKPAKAMKQIYFLAAEKAFMAQSRRNRLLAR